MSQATLIQSLLRSGAGGYVTSISIAPDGTKVITTDTHNAYKLIVDSAAPNGVRWAELFTRGNLPSADVPFPDGTLTSYSAAGYSDGPGVWALAAAPSNSSRLFGVWFGYVVRSDDGGATWVFPNTSTRIVGQANAQAFGPERLMNPRIAIDPQNPDRFFLSASDGSSLLYSEDAGVTLTDIRARVPRPFKAGPLYGPYMIQFDASSAVVGGRTQRVIIASYGNGVYESTNGGTTFAALSSSGMPTVGFRQMDIDSAGRIWITDSTDGTGAAYRYASGAWSKLIPAAIGFYGACVNPTNADHVIVWAPQYVAMTRNGTSATPTWTTWATYLTGTRLMHITDASDVPWLASASDFGSFAQFKFSPDGTELWIAAGIGVFKVSPIPTSSATATLDFVSVSYGIEQMVLNDIICPVSGHPATAQDDRSGMGWVDPSKTPPAIGPDTSLNHGSSVSASPFNPLLVAVRVGGGKHGLSSDGGITYAALPGRSQLTAGTGGCIIVSTALAMLDLPGQNQVAKITFDGGLTWNNLGITGLPTTTGGSIASGWGFNDYTVLRKIGCADPVHQGVFYAYNYGAVDSSGTAIAGTSGVHRFDNSATPTRIKNGAFLWSGWNARLESVPGYAGHLFFTSGKDQTTEVMKFCKDAYTCAADGSTWTDVPGLAEVWDVGFGKAKAGNTYPTIFAVGFNTGRTQFGRWQCDNFNPNDMSGITWTKQPSNDNVVVPALGITGDPGEYGRFYATLRYGAAGIQGRLRARYGAS